jgi:hypothetical protein
MHRVQAWWLAIPQEQRRVLMLAWAYFVYQGIIQFAAAYLILGPGIMLGAQGTPVLRDAWRLALGYLQVAAGFTLLIWWRPKVAPWACAFLLIVQAIFLSLPSPLRFGAELLLLAVIPLAILVAMCLVALPHGSRPRSAP